MGVLDDAIREHLELKRRHGAPESEVQQKEREVLGQPGARQAPVGGDADQDAAVEGAEQERGADAPASDHGGRPTAGEARATEAEPSERHPEPGDGTGAGGRDVEREAGYDPPTEVLPSGGAGRGGPEPAVPEQGAESAQEPEQGTEPAPEPPPRPSVEPTAPPRGPGRRPESATDEPSGGETPSRGFEQVEDAPLPADDAGDDDEDVLEETPEFLQETPEHDRLWFEQRPPRDFDFDDE